MSTYMQYRAPNNTFQPTQWTRTLIWTLGEYTYSQWTDCNDAITGPHSKLPGLHTGSLKTQIKEAYHNSSTIPVNKWSITFGIPLTLQLEQTTTNMEAWLLRYQAGQKHLANILTQECVAAIFWCIYSINDSTQDSTDDYTLDFTLDYTLESKWIFDPTLKLWCSNEYLVPHWNLDTRMNIWSHIETLILKRIFGHTLKPWYSNERFIWILNGMYVNAMLGLVKCFWCNLGYVVALNIHAIYLPHSTSHDKVHAELKSSLLYKR